MCGGFCLDLYPNQFENNYREQSQSPELKTCLALHDAIKLPAKAGLQSEFLLEMAERLFSVASVSCFRVHVGL